MPTGTPLSGVDDAVAAARAYGTRSARVTGVEIGVTVGADGPEIWCVKRPASTLLRLARAMLALILGCLFGAGEFNTALEVACGLMFELLTTTKRSANRI